MQLKIRFQRLFALLNSVKFLAICNGLMIPTLSLLTPLEAHMKDFSTRGKRFQGEKHRLHDVDRWFCEEKIRDSNNLFTIVRIQIYQFFYWFFSLGRYIGSSNPLLMIHLISLESGISFGYKITKNHTMNLIKLIWATIKWQ